MTKKLPKGIDPRNIPTQTQFDATVAMAELEKQTGCASWCNPDQKSLIVYESDHFVVRQEHLDFKKAPGVDRWFIIAKRHASLMELLSASEGADLLQTKQWVCKEFNIKGCFINRVGPPENTASGLRDDHYFEIVVRTTPGYPYGETLVKNLTGENLKRLDERVESFTK